MTAMNGRSSESAWLRISRKRRASSGSATPNSSSAWSMGIRICASPAPALTRRSLAKPSSARAGSGPKRSSLSLRQSAAGPEAVASARQLVDRVQAGPHRRRDDPVAAGAFQPRNDAGPQQRGLARSGRPQERDQLGAALRAPRFEPLDQAADVVVAAEIDRGVLFLEGEQTRKRRAAGVPCEAALGVERDPHQLAREPFEPALAIAGAD